jgi:fructoselysine transporter
METPPPPTLHRALTPLEVMFLTFSALSPALSVFIFGDTILHMAGTGAAAAVLVGGAIAAIMAFLYAELGAAFPQAGGVYPSLVGVLGPLWAFPYIAMMMLLAPTLVAFTVLGLADYIRVLAPGLPAIPVALACMVLAAGVAMLRIRTSAIITGVFLAIEAAALLVVTVMALLHPARSLTNVLAHPVVLDHGALAPLTGAALGLAVVSGVFTTGGASWAMYLGEELKDAERKIGPVIAWAGPLAAVAIALPLALMVLSADNLQAVLGADAPMAAYIARTGGPVVGAVVNAGLVVAFFNAVVAEILGYSRLFYATGRDGYWPGPLNRLLGQVNPTMRSPVAATTVLCLCASGLMLLGEQKLLILSSGQSIFEFLLMAVAVLIGRKAGMTGARFRAPLHPLIPLFALVSIIAFVVADWLDPDAGRPSLMVLSAIFVGSLAYYWARNRRGRSVEITVVSAQVIEIADET